MKEEHPILVQIDVLFGFIDLFRSWGMMHEIQNSGCGIQRLVQGLISQYTI